MAYQEPPRRRSLTPIGEELQVRSAPLGVGKPSLLDRWRRRRRLLPVATTWYGRLAIGLVRFAIVLGFAVGATVLIALLGGWTHGKALDKTFIIVGGALISSLSLAVFGGGWGRWDAIYSRTVTGRERGQQAVLAVAGLCLFGIGLYLDARH
jgi:hypothetical protein